METKNKEYFVIHDDGKKSTTEIILTLKDILGKECHDLSCTVCLIKEADIPFPPPLIPTTRWFKKTKDAEDPISLDTNKLIKGDPAMITFRERLLMEIQNFKETKERMDRECWTLCLGSPRPDGAIALFQGLEHQRSIFINTIDFVPNKKVKGDAILKLKTRKAIPMEACPTCHRTMT